MLVEDGVEDVSLEARAPEALPDAAPLTEPEAELGELVSLETVELPVLGSLLATREESVLVAELSLEVEVSLLATVESVAVRPVGERSSPEDVAPAVIEPEELVEELGVWLASVSELAVESASVLAVVSAEDVLLASVVPAVVLERSVSEVELVEPLALPAAVPARPNELVDDGVELVELLGLEDELLLILLFVVLLFAIDVFCVELDDGWDEVVSAVPEAEVVPFNPNDPEVVDVLAEFAVSLLATFALLMLLVGFDVLTAASVAVEVDVSPVTTTGEVAVVVVAVVPYSVDGDRVSELQPASARPARQRMKIDLFIGDLSCRTTDRAPSDRFSARDVTTDFIRDFGRVFQRRKRLAWWKC